MWPKTEEFFQKMIHLFSEFFYYTVIFKILIISMDSWRVFFLVQWKEWTYTNENSANYVKSICKERPRSEKDMKFLSETQTLNRSAPFYSVCQREGIKKKWGKSFYISSLSALPPNFFSLQSTQFLPNWNKKKSPQAKSSWAQLVCRSKNLHFPKAFKKSSWHFQRLMSKKKKNLP